MGAISFNNKLYPTGGTSSASMSVYDNSDSGLDATNVQDAVDEVVEAIDNLDASNLVYDNSTTGLPNNVQGAIDKTTSNISSLGTVELTATAAHAHAVGTYFIWIGQFVETTVAISVGDTIADTGNDANVEPITIANILTAANSAITTKQNATDNSLTTTAKTITGAINELQSGKQAALTNPLTQSDVINNLTSTATNVPLSAAMGKSLNGLINNLLKIATQTVTTTQLGTIFLTIPQDGKWILTIYDSNKFGFFYIVKYHNTMYGAFHYAPPHDPLVNTEITVTFIYI